MGSCIVRLRYQKSEKYELSNVASETASVVHLELGGHLISMIVEEIGEIY
jgi:hypothetical protein